MKPILIGGKEVYLGGTRNLDVNAVDGRDIIISLNGNLPHAYFGETLNVCCATMSDYGGVPARWKDFINEIVDKLLAGKSILAYCTGGHGRTGTFAASLIAVMEPEIEDPVEEIRKRHCKDAVETFAQMEGVFALKGMKVPEKHTIEKKPIVYSGYQGGHSVGGNIIYSGGSTSKSKFSMSRTHTASQEWWKEQLALETVDWRKQK